MLCDAEADMVLVHLFSLLFYKLCVAEAGMAPVPSFSMFYITEAGTFPIPLLSMLFVAEAGTITDP